MAYAAETDLDAKWGAELVTLAAWNDALTPAGRDESRIAAALGGAASIIDGYLSRRYALPLAPTASGLALLTALNADLAMGQLANTPGTRNEIVEAAEKRALAFLKDVARGDASIDVIPPPDALPALSPNEAVLIRGHEAGGPDGVDRRADWRRW